MSITLEPRAVERPFIGRWLRTTGRSFLRSPVRFGRFAVWCLICIGVIAADALAGPFPAFGMTEAASSWPEEHSTTSCIGVFSSGGRRMCSTNSRKRTASG